MFDYSVRSTFLDLTPISKNQARQLFYYYNFRTTGRPGTTRNPNAFHVTEVLDFGDRVGIDRGEGHCGDFGVVAGCVVHLRSGSERQ